MSHNLNPSNYARLTASSTAVTSGPITLSLWKKTSTFASAMLLEVSNGTNSTRLTLVEESPSNDEVIGAYAAGGGTAALATLYTTINYGWQHVCAVFASDTYRVSYIDGVMGTPSTLSVNTTGLNSIFLGSRSDYAFLYNGTLAEAAIYNAALTQEEVIMLSKGISAELVRPQNLKIYAPLIRDTSALAGGFNFTSSSTYVFTHPKIYQ